MVSKDGYEEPAFFKHFDSIEPIGKKENGLSCFSAVYSDLIGHKTTVNKVNLFFPNSVWDPDLGLRDRLSFLPLVGPCIRNSQYGLARVVTAMWNDILPCAQLKVMRNDRKLA